MLERVPGCDGLGDASYDYCILNPYAASATQAPTEGEMMVASATQAPTESAMMVVMAAEQTSAPTLPLLEIVADNKDSLLGLCQGKCKDNGDCEGDLLCFAREEGDIDVPGCSGIPEGKYYYCVAPLIR